jgi:hypothetical protein
MSNAEKGKQILMFTVIWLILKEVVNSVIGIVQGGDFGGFLPGIAVTVAFAAALLYAPGWIKFLVAGVLILQTLRFLVPNISDIIGWGGLYLAEGIIDIIFAIVLCTNAGVTAFYEEKNK